jgi:hypothetical protein
MLRSPNGLVEKQLAFVCSGKGLIEILQAERVRDVGIAANLDAISLTDSLNIRPRMDELTRDAAEPSQRETLWRSAGSLRNTAPCDPTSLRILVRDRRDIIDSGCSARVV